LDYDTGNKFVGYNGEELGFFEIKGTQLGKRVFEANLVERASPTQIELPKEAHLDFLFAGECRRPADLFLKKNIDNPDPCWERFLLAISKGSENNCHLWTLCDGST